MIREVVPCQFYALGEKLALSVEIHYLEERISFLNPQGDTLFKLENGRLRFMKRGWVFTEFVGKWGEETPRNKLVFYNSDGDKIRKCIEAWDHLKIEDA